MAPLPALPPVDILQVRSISAGRLNLNVLLWGDTAKPLVLLQHGAKDHGRSWDWTVAQLTDDYCCVVPDLRGHGDSDWPPGGGYDTLDFVHDMAAIVETLLAETGQDRLSIIAHSLGGNIALHYAALQQHRIQRIVCIEGLGFNQRTYDQLTEKPAVERMRAALERRMKAAGRPPRRFAQPEDAIRRLANLHPKLDLQQAEHLATHGLQAVKDGWRWKHDPLFGGMPPRPVSPSEYGPVFRTVNAPVLLMYGDDSWATNPADDGRIEFFRNARLRTYENAGHWLHHDRFDDFIGDVRAFLKET